jgi:zinc transport system substrate-binding protein
MKNTLTKAFAGLASILLFAGCGEQRASRSTAADGKLMVVATIFPLADWASQIGGDRVTTATLLPPGVSPHTYEPTPADMRNVSQARLFLKSGLNLDDWAAKVTDDGPKASRIIPVGDRLHEQGYLPDVEHIDESVHDVAHEHGAVNPHWFLDPNVAIRAVEMIAAELGAADPAHRSAYNENAARYIEELNRLDEELSSTLAACSERGFATVHNSFAYLAARYKVRIAAVIEEYPGRVPSDQYIRGVVDKLRADGVKTVFVEPQLSRRPAEIVAEEAGARVDLLDPVGDASYADRDTYLKLMRFNGAKLKEAVCP